jgi:hypothetical protein
VHELHTFEKRGRALERDVAFGRQIEVIAFAAADVTLVVVHRMLDGREPTIEFVRFTNPSPGGYLGETRRR